MKFSSSVLLICFAASTVAVAAADERAGRVVTALRGDRRLRRTSTSQSSDVGQAGRNTGGKKKKKGKKKKGPKSAEKAMKQASAAFSQFTSTFKEFESKKEGQAMQGTPTTWTPPKNPTTWTPPASVKQEGGGTDSSNGVKNTPNTVELPESKETDNGMPEKQIEGMPELSKPETETAPETLPETVQEKQSGVGATTPLSEEKPPEGSVPAETGQPELEVSPPAQTTSTTTGAGGTSSGNTVVSRPVAPVGANCNLNIASLAAKEDPSTTTKKCRASCECADSCCIQWTFGMFCAEPHPTREGRASFGGGYMKCKPLSEPSQ